MASWFKRDTTKTLRSQAYLIKLLAVLLLTSTILLSVTGAFLRLTPAHASAGDWSMYLHDFQRTGASDDTTLSPSNAGQLSERWSFKTGGVVASSPTVVGGVVYVGSWDGYEYALDATTGMLKWKTYLGVTAAPNCNPPSPGISSGAAVQNGVVYTGGGDAYWYALDALTGNVMWKVYTGDNSAASGHYNWSSPLLYNGYAYIGVASLGDCPLVQGQLLQVSLNSHQVVNTFNVVPAGQVGGGIWSSPSIDTTTNTIYVTTGTENDTSQALSQAVIALDASTLVVKSSWKLPEAEAVTDSDFGTTPILFDDAAGNPMMAAIDKNGYAYAFNRTNISAGPLWKQLIAIGGDCPLCGQGSTSSATFGKGTLYLAGGETSINGQGYMGSVRALDPATGNYRWQHGAPGIIIPALAYVNGLIIDGAGATLEVLDAISGKRLYSYTTSNTLYAAPSVSAGQIFTGNMDGNVYAFSLPDTPQPTPTTDPNCPSTWSCQDIGNPTPAGSENITGNTWTVQAGGTGIGASSDQFRLISQNGSGDTQISSRVVSQQATGSSAQAGLMFRQTSDPASPYYAIFLTNGNGVVVQYRPAYSGATTTDVQMITAARPLYLEIQRVGDQFQAATSNDGTNFTLVPGSTLSVVMPTTVAVGVAVSSDSQETLDTVVFGAVNVGLPNIPPNPPPSATPCPGNWSCGDIGNPALIGSQSLGSATWTLQAAGDDIWGSFDQFHYVWQTLTSDGSISARIFSQTNTSDWAKAGVMLRQSTDPTSPYYAAFVTPGHGIVVQYRTSQGFGTSQLAGNLSKIPVYLLVARSGSTYSTYTSSNGTTWTPLAGSSVILSLSGSILAGIATTSHNGGDLGTIAFDTVSVSATLPPVPGCASGWSCADIGSPSVEGSQFLSDGTWTVQGAGGDIWGSSDQFHYVWQALDTDGSIRAHIASQTNSDTWAKTGVMMRQSSDPASVYYFAFVTPDNGINVQYRSTQGGNATQLVTITGSVPVYLQVARSGSNFSTYTSSDGVTWTPLAGSSISLSMNGSILAGLAVTSHNTGTLSTATFDTVSTGCPGGWNCGDIGNPALVGSQFLSGGTWTVQGAGGDIWETSDQFRYIWQSLPSDGSIKAHVLSQMNTDAWAKAGVMLRQSVDPASPYYFAFVTPGNGVAVQYRLTAGGNAAQQIALPGTVPTYLMVARSGNTYSTFTSSDGSTWTALAGSGVTMNLNGSILAGLAVTSHNVDTLSSDTFDAVNISSSLPPPSECASGWTCADLGDPALMGSQSLSGGSWTVQGAGGDIWEASDQFHYLWQSLTGDGDIKAHILTQTNTSSWAKAGVMLRQNSDPGSAYYFAFVTPGNGIDVQYRTSQGASAGQLVGITGIVPTYLMVARSGSTYATYTSSDGANWTQLDGSSITMSMSGSILAGLAVTSHNVSAPDTVTFDTVSVT